MSIIEVNDKRYLEIGIQARTQKIGVELDMVKKFIEFKKCSFIEKTNNHLAIFVEPKINNAYPDVVFAEYNPQIYERWNNYRDNLSLLDLKVLNNIYLCGKATSEDVVKHLCIKYKDLLGALENLFDANLIDRIHGKWVIINQSFFGIQKIESVEAKIYKWSEVFQQALLNKNFSSECSVLMKLKNEPKNDIFNTLSEFGIGLYVFNEKEFSRIKEPTQFGVPSNYNSFYINEWIGRILNCTEASNGNRSNREGFPPYQGYTRLS